nr:hypothetical protein [Tanacetum cinerariifolium]
MRMDQMRNENKSLKKVPRTLYSVSNAKIKLVEKTEEFPGFEIVKEVNQNGVLHEEKGEEEGAEIDNGKKKYVNPLIMVVREDNNSYKIKHESSATMSNLNEDEDEDDEKE